MFDLEPMVILWWEHNRFALHNMAPTKERTQQLTQLSHTLGKKKLLKLKYY